MALATTCTKCNTSFRVAPDQLALRRGMVRCGVCQNVFSGMANLRHVDEILRQRGSAQAAAEQILPPSESSQYARKDKSRGKPDPRINVKPLVKAGSPSPPRMGSAPNTFAQTDLRTAFFLPETVFGPTTEMVAEGESFLSEPAAVPKSIQPQADQAFDAGQSDSAQTSLADSPVAGNASGANSASVLPDSSSGDALLPFDSSKVGSNNVDSSNDDSNKLDSNKFDSDKFESDEAADIALRQAGPDTRIRWAQEATQVGAAETDPTLQPPTQTVSVERRKRGSRRRSSQERDRSDEAIAYFEPEASAGGFSSRSIAFGWLFCVIAAAVLGIQLLIGARNLLASNFPALHAPLQAISSPLGLAIEAPLDLQAVTIESFELQAGDTPGVLMLSALLRNRADRGTQWPALEIVLTDGQGTLLVRKVLLPKDYFPGLPPAAIRQADLGMSPRAELPLKLALEARELAASGYSVTLFYP